MIKAYLTAILLTPMLVIASFLYLDASMAGICVVASPAVAISIFFWHTIKADPRKRRRHLLIGFLTVITVWTVTVTKVRSIASKRTRDHGSICVEAMLAGIDLADSAVIMNGDFPDLEREKEIATITDADVLKALVAALELTECNPRGYTCGCNGHPWITFKQGSHTLGRARFQHGLFVEWTGRSSLHRAGMTSNSMIRVKAWFDAQNIPTPRGGGLVTQPEEPSTNRISLPNTSGTSD